MHRSIVVALIALGIVAMAGEAIACPASVSSNSNQQTVMTDPATTPTPAPGKPGG
jgi:hypothetical protein